MLVFFVHRLNDIDHLAPIIYKIANESNKKILVLGINPFAPLLEDFRLKFLQENFNVRVEYLTVISNRTMFQNFFGKVIFQGLKGTSVLINLTKIFWKSKSKSESKSKYKVTLKSIFRGLRFLFLGVLKSIISRLNIYSKFSSKIYNQKWSDNLLLNIEASILIFDHAATSSKAGALADVSPVKHIINSANKIGIPIISLPHGVPLFVNHPKRYDEIKKYFSTDLADFIVIQHKYWLKELTDFGLDERKSSVLGLPRYCEEWIPILHKIVPYQSNLKNKGVDKLKVVYMDTGPNNYGKKKNFVQEIIYKINELDFVYLIYKPHTRSNKSHFEINSKIENGKTINSINLIKWADVVIGMHSSIMIEALIQKKIYLSPSHFRNHKMLYEKYEACWLVENDSEIIDALKKIKLDLNFRPYSDENVQLFLKDIVYAGKKNGDV